MTASSAGTWPGCSSPSLIPLASAANLIALRAAAARVDLVPAIMLGGFLSALLALPLALPFQASAKDLALLAFLGVFQLGVPCMLMVVVSRVLPPPEIALLALLEVLLGRAVGLAVHRRAARQRGALRRRNRPRRPGPE